MIGFRGSRSLSSSWSPLVARVVAAAAPAPARLLVGCAAGADRLVRRAAGSRAEVWAVAGGRFGSGRAAFARRSAAMVQALAAGAGSSLIGFCSSPCPAGVVPASRWRSGMPPSGTWSSLALAAGLGVQVVVFWCAACAACRLPAWPGGRWLPAALGLAVESGGWRWEPARLRGQVAEQGALW